MTWRRKLLLLFLAGLVIRLAAAAWTGLDGPWVGDERGYVLVARSWIAGEGFALPFPDDVAPGRAPLTSFRTPGLPLLLSPAVALGASDAVLRLLSVLVGACLGPLLLVALRGTRWEDRGHWAALGLACWPPLVFLSLRILTEPWAIAATLAAIPLLRSGRGVRTTVGGLLLGYATLLRPALLPTTLLMLVLPLDRRRIGLAAAGLVLVLAPWVARNHALHGRPLLSTNSGVTWVGANSQAAADAEWPGKWLPPTEVYRGDDAPDLGMWGWSELSEAESDSRFTRHAFAWIAEHPGDAFVLTLQKYLRLFDPDPRSRQADASRKAWIGWLTVPPLLLLAGVGLASLRGIGRDALPWIACLAGTLATTTLFYGDTRMRTPADPALFVLALHGATVAWDRWTARRNGSRAGEITT